jgi:hypothetical protein
MHLFRCLLAVAVLLLPGCRESAGPPAPAAVQPIAGPAADATAGGTAHVGVRVTDAQGRPVSGVPVTWLVTAGSGVVTGESGATDASGAAHADWMLGTIAGQNTLSATAQGLPAVTFAVAARAGPAASIVVQNPPPASARVGTQLGPVSVVVNDRHGNPVAGAAVVFAVVDGGGSIAARDAVTDAGGAATAGMWTLGTTAGGNTLSAAVGALEAVVMTTVGTPGPPAALAVAAGGTQTGAAGIGVPVRPSVVVHDAHENPVPGVVVHFAGATGGGVVSGGQQVTGENGVATVEAWTLGPAFGPQSLTATVPGLAPLAFTADAVDPTGNFNLFIESVQINQGGQSADGSIGGVAGRPALLRVVARASALNVYAPQLRVRLYQGGTLMREVLLPAPGVGVPVAPDLNVLNHTWNLPLTAAEVVDGLAVEAMLDPAESIPVRTRADNRFPRSAALHSFDVRSMAPLRIVFIPIHDTLRGRTGSITSGNRDAFLEATRKWFPVSAIESTVRTPYTTGLDLSTAGGWSTLLGEIQALRTVEGATDAYYHGIVGDFANIAYGGLAYAPTLPTSPFRSGLSYDRMPDSPETIAHELAHNLGRLHAPCGGPGFLDWSYPYADARLGAPSFDIHAGTLRADAELRDYMSYCYPGWTSDYTYRALLQWRRADPLAQSGAALPASYGERAGVTGAHARTGGLLVWGRIAANGVTLNPAFAIDAAPRLPDSPGRNVLLGTAADGRELFRISFDGVAVADGADPDERHFAWFIPLGPAEIGALARIDLTTPAGSASRESQAGLAGAGHTPDAEIRVEAASGDRIRVEWDDARYPMALVRDPRTGQVLSFARGGTALMGGGALAPGQLEVIVSDGVHSRAARRR